MPGKLLNYILLPMLLHSEPPLQFAAAAVCLRGRRLNDFFLYFRFEKSLPTATEYIMRSYNILIISQYSQNALNNIIFFDIMFF